MGIGIIELIEIVIILYILYYYYFIKSFKFWKSRGIPGPDPLPLFGTVKDIILGKISIGDYAKKEYMKYKSHPMFGVFLNRDPVLVINDPELIKEVMVQNFSNFSSRGNVFNEVVEPLSPSIINIEHDRWKPLRMKQIGIFSTGKIKGMFHLLLECADHFEKVIDKAIDQSNVIDCCKLVPRFTTDVIGNCVFGIDMKALENENSQFHNMGVKVTNVNAWRAFKNNFKQVYPYLYGKLSYIMYDYEVNNFFIKNMVKIMDYRKNNNIKRGDFVDLLNELKQNSGRLNNIELTDSLLTAQAFGFFLAGVDTSPITISHALYELALNQHIQNKLREEINKVLMLNNGKLDFENIKEMKYLDKVLDETLRKYPAVNFLQRQVVNSYTFSKPKVSIPKDTRIWISVSGIHENPEFYENPEIFDPERFSEEKIKERHSFVYLPFGNGPRSCIATRFSKIQVKVGIITILKKYKIDTCEKTPFVYESNPRRFVLAPKNGLHLKFTKLNEPVI